MQEFKSLREAINERTLAASKGRTWRAMSEEDLVATLEELDERGMLAKE